MIIRSCIFLLAVVASCSSLTTIEDDSGLVLAPMDAKELEAFYRVLSAMNHEYDWRSLLPDPCGANTLQGMSCDTSNSNDTLFHVTHLSFGSFQSNTPGCSSNATIDPSIASLTHLSRLSFFGCFNGSTTTIPAASLPPSLQTLAFHNNPALEGSLPAEIGRLSRLERLILDGNSLRGELPEALGNLSSLEQLVVSNNAGIEGAIPATIANLSKLVILDLSQNSLNSSSGVQFGRLNLLQKLDLSGNRLGDFPSSIRGLTNLQLLDLSRNGFRKNATFPHELLELPELRELYLQKNPGLRGNLPESGWNLHLGKLISMDASDCGLTGLIPAGLARAASLRFLGLAGNGFEGHIPQGFANMPSLREVDLSRNRLVGSIPFDAVFVRRAGINLKLSGNAGLCFKALREDEQASLIEQGVIACGNSSLPLAFEVASSAAPAADSPLSSSSHLSVDSFTFLVFFLLAMVL